MNALKDFKWFFILLLVVWLAWVFTGGPKNKSSNDPFIKPPSPIDTGETYGFSFFGGKNIWASNNTVDHSETKKVNNNDTISNQVAKIEKEAKKIQEELEKAKEKTKESKYINIVSFKKGPRTNDVNREYIKIIVSKKANTKIPITGWKIKSVITGEEITIGEASWLPRMGAVNKKNTLVLSPGDKAIISTGRSPIGVSFRTNICTGYFEQFQNFSPSLNKSCPRPEDEIPVEYLGGPNRFNDACLDFIDRIYRCNVNTRDIPWDMQPQCQTFVTRNLNYNSCVDRHNNEEDFYGNTWRMFLNRNTKLWKTKREIIKLFDLDGKIVDVISY